LRAAGVCARLDAGVTAAARDEVTVVAGCAGVLWTVGDGVVTCGCTVFGWLVVGDEVLVGAASGLTPAGAGSGLGKLTANACGASTSDHAKMTALHPAGSPPRLRLDGAGADCAATIQVTATPD
jgi:hypothetical protein